MFLHLRNAELKGHTEASSMLRGLKNIYINEVECMYLQELKSYITNLPPDKNTQFILSRNSVSLLKELTHKLDKAESYQQREILINNYLSDVTFMNNIDHHQKTIEILINMQKNYASNKPSSSTILSKEKDLRNHRQ